MRRHSFLLVVPSLLLAVSARGEVIERIVAKVNGEIITLSEFQGRQIQEAQAARIPRGPRPGVLARQQRPDPPGSHRRHAPGAAGPGHRPQDAPGGPVHRGHQEGEQDHLGGAVPGAAGARGHDPRRAEAQHGAEHPEAADPEARSRAQGRGHGHRGPGRLRRPQAGVQPPGHGPAPGDPGQGRRRQEPRRGPGGEGPRRRGFRRPGAERIPWRRRRPPGASSESSRAGR